jgi:aldehyde:ferredoxin oxidoreductase
MALGYNNKILIVNLTTGNIQTEEPGEKFYRMYLGGSGIGAYYCMKNIPKGADPLGPDNVLALSTGVVTGAPVMTSSRIIANAKSPVTGGIGDSQGGGYFGPAMKFAGYDAVIIKGRAEKPVYLFIQDGKAEIRDASHIWGMTTKDFETQLRSEMGRDVVVCGIGPAGENLCRYACIINERRHACGRTGMGAVMGSKNLKCVAAIGKKAPYEYADADVLQINLRFAGEWAKTSPQYERLHNFGTNGGLVNQNRAGMLPTKNYTEGYFEPAERTLSSIVMNDTISIGTGRCYTCNIACKRHVQCTKEKDGWDVDEAYGGPEYETVAAMGSYLCIDDLATVSKANEICNAYTIDTISTGEAIAFAMDLFEHGILTKEQCYGHELRFGNREGAIDLLMKIVTRDGWLGNLLAEGTDAAAKAIGNGAEYYAMTSKGMTYPAHMPQVKKNLAVHYAVSEYGPDHMTCSHDPNFDVAGFEGSNAQAHYSLGIYEPVPYRKQVEEKMKINYFTRVYNAVLNGITVCNFGYSAGGLYNIERMVEIVNGVTGWGTNMWELMKSGERAIVLMRLFNRREGLDETDDVLPKCTYEQKLSVGPAKGEHVEEDEFYHMRSLYYEMAGLDEHGHPRHGKVMELDLSWAEEMLKQS